MSEEKNQREKALEGLNEAIGNGQVHPAVAEFLSVLDKDVQAYTARHDDLVLDLEAQRAERESADVRAAEDRREAARDDARAGDEPAANVPDGPDATPVDADTKATPAKLASPAKTQRGSIR